MAFQPPKALHIKSRLHTKSGICTYCNVCAEASRNILSFLPASRDLKHATGSSHAMSTPNLAVLVLALTLGNTHAIGVATPSAAIVCDADEPLVALT
jgi:hypothetical protein